MSGGFHQPFPPRTENIAAVEIELVTQLVDGLIAFLNGLVVELGGLFKCGLEILDLLGVKLGGLIEISLEIPDLLSELAQQVVAFAGISGP